MQEIEFLEQSSIKILSMDNIFLDNIENFGLEIKIDNKFI